MGCVTSTQSENRVISNIDKNKFERIEDIDLDLPNEMVMMDEEQKRKILKIKGMKSNGWEIAAN